MSDCYDSYIENVFKVHDVTFYKRRVMASLRNKFRALAHIVAANCPESTETDRSIDYLDQALMLAVASIARNEYEEEEELPGPDEDAMDKDEEQDDDEPVVQMKQSDFMELLDILKECGSVEVRKVPCSCSK